MDLGTWYWDSKVCKWCCSRIYKREGKGIRGIHSSPPRFSLASTQRKGECGDADERHTDFYTGRGKGGKGDSDKEIHVDYKL